MRNILKGFLNLSNVEEYRFPDAAELQEEEEASLPDFSEEEEAGETPPGVEAEPEYSEYEGSEAEPDRKSVV